MSKFLLLFVIFIFFNDTDGNQFFQFKNLDRQINGLIFPNNIRVMEGHDIRLQLWKTVNKQESCVLRDPTFSEHDVGKAHIRYDSWGDCGVIIKNITKSDIGYWRLVSQSIYDKIEGIVSVFVEDMPVPVDENIDINIGDEEKSAIVEFEKQNTSYCYLSQKDTDETIMVPGKCTVELETISKSIQGPWKIYMGIPGILEEKFTESHVKLNTETVDVGYVYKDNVIKLHCNLKYTRRNLTFCRFERGSDEKGFNLIDGLGKGRYSYYGRGFYEKDCGLMITHPTNEDYGNWKCSVGLIDSNKSFDIVNRALIVDKPTKGGNRILSNNKILGVNNTKLKISCNANITIEYCTMEHPNGTEYPMIIKDDPEYSYQYDKKKLEIGICEIILKNVTYTDSGVWRCHMGNRAPGLEVIDTVKVEIGGPIAAIDPIITISQQTEAILHCITVENHLPLEYCRFKTPSGERFNIDESITQNNSIMGEYYFKANASINRGDCIVIIKKPMKKHLGKWACSALIQGKDIEYSDYILLVEESTKSVASVAGIAVGLIIVIASVGFFGFIVWKRHKGTIMQRLRSSATSSARPTLQETTVHFTGRPSGDSDTSSGDIEIHTSTPTQGPSKSSG